MDCMTFPPRKARAALPYAVAVAILFCFTIPSFAQERALEGVWAVTSTPRDCTTGAALGPPVRALHTYHQGGTVTESAALLLFAPGQRSNGHGVWTHAGGPSYVERLLSIILFDSTNDPPTFRAGWTLTQHTITLTTTNSFTSSGRTAFYDLNRQFLREVCASRVGEQFR